MRQQRICSLGLILPAFVLQNKYLKNPKLFPFNSCELDVMVVTFCQLFLGALNIFSDYITLLPLLKW